MANILGDLDTLTGRKRLCLRYVLDVEEWKELVNSSRSLSQLKKVWSRVARIEPKLRNNAIANVLIRAFGKRGHLKGSLRVFDAVIAKNPKSWLLVLCSFAHTRCFEEMVCRSAVEEARKRFESSSAKTQQCWNTMLAAYAQNGHLADAKQLFDEMPVRDVVSWSSMMAANSLNRNYEETIVVFKRMPSRDQASWTALIALHAQLRNFKQAIALFDLMPDRDIAAWNIIFATYTFMKDFKTGMELRRVMDLEGTLPDELSFVSLLLGCPSPRVARGCIRMMILDYGIDPVKLHYDCVLDLFHREGYRRKIDMEPFKASIPDDGISSSGWVAAIVDAGRRRLRNIPGV